MTRAKKLESLQSELIDTLLDMMTRAQAVGDVRPRPTIFRNASGQIALLPRGDNKRQI